MNDFLYPYGTTELYPNMATVGGLPLDNTAHEYRECSNAGYCDRVEGVCHCIEGFEGSACQRMSCPSFNDLSCNGHGMCSEAEEFAHYQYENVYRLWDGKMLQGCLCDPGYIGAACQLRQCKAGFDPIYQEQTSRRYSNWTFVIASNRPQSSIIGNYSIVFFDQYGQDWMTSAIQYNASCPEITSALEDLPNNVVPRESVRCLRWPSFSSSDSDAPHNILTTPFKGVKYILSFPSNPGELRQPEFNIFLDGKRPTLTLSGQSDVGTSPGSDLSLSLDVFPDGFSGENLDYFPSLCVGVDFTLEEFSDAGSDVAYVYLTGLTPIEKRLLAQCLGDSDGDLDTFSASGRVMGQNYTWDYGSVTNPHLIRLQDLTQPALTDMCKGDTDSQRPASSLCSFPFDGTPSGFLAPLIYDPNDNLFKVLTRPTRHYDTTTLFTLYSTDGVAQASSLSTKILTNPLRYASRVVFSVNATSSFPGYDGDIACETTTVNVDGVLQCVEKDDIVFVVDPYLTQSAFVSNPSYLNLYKVEKIWQRPSTSHNNNNTSSREIVLDKSIVSAWGVSDEARMYVFSPPSDAFRYVSQCSNRGLCDEHTGLCQCFPGFNSDDCSVQDNSPS